jgi:dTMP kinase
MALVPDAVFYLRITNTQQLVERVLTSGRGFDYWESGMDLNLGEDLYDSFIEYQKRMLKVFDRLTGEYGFQVLNASRSVRTVAADLRKGVLKVLEDPGPVTEDNVSMIERRGKPSQTKPTNLVDLNKKVLP